MSNEEMSEQQQKELEQFWMMVDKFIDVANSNSETLQNPGLVSSAMISATARFNAFYIASNSESKKDLKEDKEDSLRRFTSEYKKRLAENVEEYIDHFKEYLGDKEEKS